MNQVRAALPASAHPLYVAFFEPDNAKKLRQNQPGNLVDIEVQPVIGWMIDATSEIYEPDPLTPLGLITRDFCWAIGEDPPTARAKALVNVETIRVRNLHENT